MPADDLFRLTFGQLRPGEQMISESRETHRALTDTEAGILCDMIRQRAGELGLKIMVGPKVIREKQSQNFGPVRHITHARAIVMDDPLEREIRKLVVAKMTIDNAALEEMVERMMVDPEGRGVVVVIDQAEQTRSYRLDERVPFGNIFEFPSMEAYEIWQERHDPM